MRRLLMTTALALFAHPALAQDAAVLIGGLTALLAGQP